MVFQKIYDLANFSLHYGVSLKKLYKYACELGSNPSNYRFKLKNKNNLKIRQKFNMEYLNTLKFYILKRLKFLWTIRIYRGIRHKLKLPARGQRTHSNSKTKRKFNF